MEYLDSKFSNINVVYSYIVNLKKFPYYILLKYI